MSELAYARGKSRPSAWLTDLVSGCEPRKDAVLSVPAIVTDDGTRISRRVVLAATLGLPSALLIAGCGKGSEGRVNRAPKKSPRPNRSVAPTIDVRSFGAVGDNQTDDTMALTRAIASLRRGQTLVVPAGHTFRHSTVLGISTAGVRIMGPGTLSASQEGASSLQVLADDVTIDSLTLTTPQTTRRWSAPDQHKLFLGQVSGTVVNDVTIIGSAAAGLFSYGASNFHFTDVHVTGTRADGIHMTNGSRGGRVVRPIVRHTGDDGVAVVSYEQDGTACSDIVIDSPVIRDLDGGRGISVVGGSNVTYSNIDVEGSSSAAVYIACEGNPYNTFPTSAVRVIGGRIANANTDSAVDHGAVLVYSGRSGGKVSDITIYGLSVSGTRSNASRQIGAVSDGGGLLADVRFTDLTLAATPAPYEGNVPVSDLTLTRVTAAGQPVVPTATP